MCQILFRIVHPTKVFIRPPLIGRDTHLRGDWFTGQEAASQRQGEACYKKALVGTHIWGRKPRRFQSTICSRPGTQRRVLFWRQLGLGLRHGMEQVERILLLLLLSCNWFSILFGAWLLNYGPVYWFNSSWLKGLTDKEIDLICHCVQISNSFPRAHNSR